MTGIIITLLIVFYRIPLINIIGDTGMGYYSTALVIYLLLMTCVAYGLPKAISSVLISYSSKGKYGYVYKTVQSALLFAVIAGGSASILVFTSAGFLAAHLMSAVQSELVIRCFAPCLLAISILGSLHGIYTGTRKFRISKIGFKAEEFFVAILSIAGALYFTNNPTTDITEVSGAAGAAVGFTCGVTIACIFMLVFFRRHYRKLFRIFIKDGSKADESHWQIIKNIIIAMLPFVMTLIIFHLTSITDYAVFNRIMKVQGHKEAEYINLIGILNGKYEFFISLPLLLVNWYAASKVSFPFKSGKKESLKKMNKKLSSHMRYTMLFIIPCTVFLFMYTEPLMNLCFNGDNRTAAILLKSGAVSIVFFSLSAITNAALNALNEWHKVTKNAFASAIVQVIALLIMMIVFEWGILAVVFSRVIFSAALYILNEHTLREISGYVQEKKRSFYTPVTGAVIMGILSYIIYFILELFIGDKTAVVIIFPFTILVYIISMVVLGGISQREIYAIPGGKYLAPLCKKLHLRS